MPPEVADGLFHLLQWEGAEIVGEIERAEQAQREQAEMDRLRKASFGELG